MLLILFSCILALLIYLVLLKPNRYWDEKGVPYVKPLPFFGNMFSNIFQLRSFTDMVNDLYKVYPDKRYVGFFQFRVPTLMIRDLELIKKIAIKEFDSFPDHRAFVAKEADPIASKNLFNLTIDDGWHDMRSTLSPTFTSSKMRSMFVLMEQCAEQFVKYFEKQKGPVELELKDSFTRYANDVIGTAAFGITCDSLADKENQFYMMGKELTTFTFLQNLKFFGFSISPALMALFKVKLFNAKAISFFRSIIKQTLQIREEKGIVRPDVIHLLMEAKKGRLKYENQTNVVDTGFAVVEESELGKKQKRKKMEITDEDITAQAVVFFFAGFDTVSTLMCYVCYELAKNPHVQEVLYKEVKENCQGKTTYEMVLGMKYLDCVISETLRKWPPVPFTDRNTIRPFTIEPEQPGERRVRLDSGANVWIPVYSIHRDSKYYPDPEKFDPDRFNDENKTNIAPLSYLPFGAGPRNCIGSRFALLETKLIIIKILQKFEIVPVDKTPNRIVLSKSNFNPLPDGGIWLGFKPRSSS
ncbi:hypothetical protein ILUMI_07590 [Ignelater luminosus]|uniref:Cytochrome P450 n=1 Tax=Ignelater luminosus TaxID=2038154 RepID=A0A8K0DD61_IGNLU|nr:hypothetical protein ILUMI_07590 [Ignelater luminosus]